MPAFRLLPSVYVKKKTDHCFRQKVGLKDELKKDEAPLNHGPPGSTGASGGVPPSEEVFPEPEASDSDGEGS